MEVSRPVDGHIDRLLRGHKIVRCTKDGHFLRMECEDGHEFRFAWVDDNGTVIRGEPVLATIDARVRLIGQTAGMAAARL